MSMAIVEWDESFSVGVHCMDEQHTVLFEMINEFYENIKKRENGNNISKLIISMRSYTMMHFVEEEGYMAQFDYPELDTHRKEHEFFLAKVAELEEKDKHGKLILSFEIINFLKSWLTNHIKVTDKRYAEFFIERGLR